MGPFPNRRYDVDSLDNRSDEAIRFFADRFGDLLRSYFSAKMVGFDRIPEGPALYVANHSGGIIAPDMFLFGLELFRSRGLEFMPYGLTHDVTINIPGVHQLIVPLGAVRATHAIAHRIFQSGKKVLVYPGGDLDSMRSHRDRNTVVFGPRRGYIKLALREGVPVVPVVTCGGQDVLFVIHNATGLAKLFNLDRFLRTKSFPIALSFPLGLTLGFPPPFIPMPARIEIETLDAISFSRTGPDAAEDRAYVEECHDKVIGAMQSALTRMAEARR